MSTSSRFDGNGCLLTPSVTADQIKKVRQDLGMTQEAFAKEFNIPLGTLRDWEQGARKSRASQFFADTLARLSSARKVDTEGVQPSINQPGQLTPG